MKSLQSLFSPCKTSSNRRSIQLKFAVLCAVALTGFGSAQARASLFTFSFSGTQDSGSGFINAVATSTSGVYQITGISGTTDGQSISGLLTAASYPFVPFASNDNLLYFPPSTNAPNTAAGAFDIYGMSYQLADGLDINIYFGEYIMGYPNMYNLMYGLTGTNDALARFTIAPVIQFGDTPIEGGAAPEPSSLLLLFTGICMLAGAGALRSRISEEAVTISRD